MSIPICKTISSRAGRDRIRSNQIHAEESEGKRVYAEIRRCQPCRIEKAPVEQLLNAYLPLSVSLRSEMKT
jgi:hypothetical protein